MKRQKSGKLLKFGRSSLVHLLILTLMQPQLAFAQQRDSVTGDVVTQGTWVQNFGGLMGKITGDITKSTTDARNKIKLAQERSRYNPAPQVSKYFPGQCTVGQAITNFPENTCNPEVPAGPDKFRYDQSQMYKAIATDQISFFEKLMTEGQNGARPVGLQCLKDQKARELAKIQAFINNLKAEADKFKEQLAAFRASNKVLLDDMGKLSGDLYGRAEKEDLDNTTKNFGDYFTPACRDIIGIATLEGANTKGLYGLKKDPQFRTKFESAIRANQNEGAWKSDLQAKIAKIKVEIGKRGPTAMSSDAFFKGVDSADKHLDKSIKEVAAREWVLFNDEYNKAKGYLQKELNYSLSELDHDFMENIEDFSANAGDFFRKKYVNECVNGGRYGLALSPQQILDGLRDERSNGRGTNLPRYKAALRNILTGDAFIDDKMNQIKALDARFGVGTITISYNNYDAQKVSDTPYNLYRKTISACTDRVKQDQTFAAGNRSKSDTFKIAKAERYLKDLKQKTSTFAANITNAINDRVLNCSGRTLKSGSCNENTMNPESDSFCIKHASTCSNAVRSCYGEMDRKIKERTGQLKALGAQYDGQVRDLIGRQKAVFKARLLPMVTGAMEQIKRYMPGADWKYTEGSFVKDLDPEKSKEFGILMLGGGKLDNLEQLPELIEKNLVGMLEDQKGKLDGKYDEYIKGQRTAMRANVDKWETLKDNCGTVEGQIADAVNQSNAAKAKGVGEQRQAVGDFCSKYALLQSNPAAGCGEGDVSPDKLYLDANKVAKYLDPSVKGNIAAYSRYCSSANNEKSRDSDDEDGDANYSKLRELCEENDGDYDDVQDEIKSAVLAGVDATYRNKASQYLEGDIDEDDLPEGMSYREKRDLKRSKAVIDEGAEYATAEKFNDEYLVGKLATLKKKKDIFAKIPAASQALAPYKDWATSTDEVTFEELKTLRTVINDAQYKDVFKGDKTEVGKIFDALAEDDAKRSKAGENLCTEHKNYARVAAALACKSSDDDASKCFKEKYSAELDQKQDNRPGDADRSIASIVNKSKNSEGLALGEQTQGPCVSQNRLGARSGNPFSSNGLTDENAALLRSMGL